MSLTNEQIDDFEIDLRHWYEDSVANVYTAVYEEISQLCAQAKQANAQPVSDPRESGWTVGAALRFYADQKHFDIVGGKTRILDTGSVASDALKGLSAEYNASKGNDPKQDAQPVATTSTPEPAMEWTQEQMRVAVDDLSSFVVDGRTFPKEANRGDNSPQSAALILSYIKWARDMFTYLLPTLSAISCAKPLAATPPAESAQPNTNAVDRRVRRLDRRAAPPELVQLEQQSAGTVMALFEQWFSGWANTGNAELDKQRRAYKDIAGAAWKAANATPPLSAELVREIMSIQNYEGWQGEIFKKLQEALAGRSE